MSMGPIIIFAVYSILFESIVWGIFGYAVFWKDHSGWWIVVAFIVSGSQLKPRHFGIIQAPKPADEFEDDK